MFNGIIKNTGRINSIYQYKNNCVFEVYSNMKFTSKEIGSSISCSGACLTLDEFNKNLIKFYVSKETLNKTIFKSLKKGDIINLEKPLKFGERVSGHYVQGHVDTTCQVNMIHFIGKSWFINFTLSRKYKINIVKKGSITVNGVSLTISKILTNGFQVVVIPKTLKLTNLMFIKQNDTVNIEFDVLGKYINNFLK